MASKGASVALLLCLGKFFTNVEIIGFDFKLPIRFGFKLPVKFVFKVQVGVCVSLSFSIIESAALPENVGNFAEPRKSVYMCSVYVNLLVCYRYLIFRFLHNNLHNHIHVWSHTRVSEFN